MRADCTEEVIVHPIGGMQLSTGVIRLDGSHHYVGNLPGMALSEGETMEEVLRSMDRFAKSYYGDDVIVEIVPHATTS